MRRDYVIAILVGAAGIAAAVALMAAPQLLLDHPSHLTLELCVYGGLLLTVILFGAAIFLAVRDEEAAKQRGERRPMLAIAGMIVFGLGFVSCAAWYFWPSAMTQPPGAENHINLSGSESIGDRILAKLDSHSRSIITNEDLVRKTYPDRQTFGPYPMGDAGGYGDMPWPEVHRVLTRLVDLGVFTVDKNDRYVWTPLGNKIAELLAAPRAKQFDNTILLDCGPAALPSVVPPEGVYWMWQLWPTPEGGDGIGQMMGKPGSEIKWPYSPLGSVKCTITNYNKDPIFNVRLVFGLEFREAISNGGGGLQSGKTTLSRDWIVDLTRIEPGAGYPFVIWIVNNSKEYGLVTLPEDIAFVPLGHDKPITARLIQPNRRYFFVNPFPEQPKDKPHG